MLGNKYKTGLCPCTCWWLRRHLRKTCRFFLLFRNTSFKLWCYAVCVKIAGMLIGYRQFSQSNCLQLFFGINSRRVGRAWKTDLAMRWTCTRVFSGQIHGQLLMLVHQLWLLLPVTALCVGEHKRLLYEQGLTHDVEALFSGSLHIVSFSSTKCRSKHLLLLTS